jgi:peptidoglycan/LPS O-acetylase OafA/YrhL/lysophospholipase L1-like esterase
MALLAVIHNLPYGADSSRVYFGTDTHASALLLGVAGGALLAARWGPLWDRRPRAWAVAALDLAGLGGLAAVVWAMMRTTEFSPGLYRGGFLLFAAASAIVVVAVSRPGGLLEFALGSPPFRWIGTRSYGLYLWHWPVFVYTRPQLDLPLMGSANLILRLTLTVALAEASYRWVEQPIRTAGVRAWLGGIILRMSGAAGALRRTAARPASTAPPAAFTPAAFAPGGESIAAWRPGEGAVREEAPRGVRHVGRAVRRIPPWQPALALWLLACLVFSIAFASSHAKTPAASHKGAAVAHPTWRVVHRLPGRLPLPAAGATQTVAAAPTPAASPTQAADSPTPTATAAPPPPRTYTAIGDSVMLGAVDVLRQTLPGAFVDAVEGRQASAGFTSLDTLWAKNSVGTDVVLQVGTNGTIEPAALDEELSRLSTRRVTLLTVHVPRPWQDLNNRIITAAAHSHPNVHLVDWNAAASAHPEWLWNDGIHLKPAGVAAYRDLILDALR